jgi:D-arabinose 1-dehydrogenase-like Zn-dependent alcohol dehydrogenase
MMTNQHVTPKMMQAMEQAGCDGFIVKMQMQSPQQQQAQAMQFSMNMVLITAARKDFPASMFEIPAGYTAMNSQNIFGNLMMMQQQKQK